MKKWAGKISLELLDRALGMHKPPLKAKLINNGPINTRDDGTLALHFIDGVEYELEAETLPGISIAMRLRHRHLYTSWHKLSLLTLHVCIACFVIVGVLVCRF